MLRDFVLELVTAPGSGATITLPGTAPTGRITWAAGFVSTQAQVFYVLDDSTMQEWGVGTLTIGAPSTITRPTVVLGNSSGTTARLNFTDTCRCYSGLPSLAQLSAISSPIGRNQIVNGLFRVQQRGAGAFTANNAYTADRWQLQLVGDTNSVTVAALADADRTAIGDESASYGLVDVVTGAATAANFSALVHRMEDVRRLAGNTVAVSFWAKGSGALNVGVRMLQNFGSGGSPSTTVVTAAQTLNVTATWTRYVLLFALPALTGKTLGSNNDHYTQISLALSSGTTNATAFGVAQQSGTFTFYGMQCEIGTYATAIEKPDYRRELANCMRFYAIGNILQGSYHASAGGNYLAAAALPVTMRGTPTVAVTSAGGSNIASATPGGTTAVAYINGTVTAAGTYSVNYTFTASADL